MGLSSLVCGWSLALLTMSAAEPADGPRAGVEKVAALAEGTKGVAVGTSGPLAVQAGVEILKKGGSAADAAMGIALAQVVECAGSYVSHAGILAMTYYEAKTGKVHYLNAGFNTPREETSPLTIPGGGKPSGRTALVPGYMAGVLAAHERFGKLPRKEIFAPAVELAEKGFTIGPMLGAFLKQRKAVLTRLPETKKIFTKPDGSFYTQGDFFRQPAWAETLRQVAEKGAPFMYSGEWAEHFVAAVQKEGGKITLADLQAYRPTWEEPLRTEHRGHEVCVPGFASTGGVAMVEALHLLALADLAKRPQGASSAENLFWLMQIGNCQALGFLAEEKLKNFSGLDLTARSRLKKETAAGIWEQMEQGKWSLGAALRKGEEGPPKHSDGLVVVDQWGNMAAVTHSINTVLWGNTGLFVDGVSIPDAASFQQQAIQRAGPGNRLADPMCPLIVLKEGKPVLGSSAIGGGLHQLTLQMLASVLDFQVDPQAAIDSPAFLAPSFFSTPPKAQVTKGEFDAKIIDQLKALGQPVAELSAAEAAGHRGYWVGVQVVPQTQLRRGVGARKPPLPAAAQGY
jgi:gamma-glutamyltranspeptidase/glutathione hydrolase